MDHWDVLLQQVINGVSLGAMYALLALGFTMVYGIIELINFAHFNVFMVGSFIAMWLMQAMGFSGQSHVLHGLPLIGLLLFVLVVTMLATGILGALIERYGLRALRGVSGPAPMITTIGLSYILFNIILLTTGADSKNYSNPMPNVRWEVGGAVLRLRDPAAEIEAGRNRPFLLEDDLDLFEPGLAFVVEPGARHRHLAAAPRRLGEAEIDRVVRFERAVEHHVGQSDLVVGVDFRQARDWRRQPAVVGDDPHATRPLGDEQPPAGQKRKRPRAHEPGREGLDRERAGGRREILRRRERRNTARQRHRAGNRKPFHGTLARMPTRDQQRPRESVPAVAGKDNGLLAHDPDKWIPVFGRDHAPPINSSEMLIRRKRISLSCGGSEVRIILAASSNTGTSEPKPHSIQ